MSYFTNRRFVQIASITLALLVPGVVMAAIVAFGDREVLSAGKLNDLSRRTLDKTRVYSSDVVETAADVNAVADAIASCDDPADILLNCSCAGARSSRAFDVRLIQIFDNDELSPNTAARCACTVQNLAATASVVSARATCIKVGRQ